MLQPLTTGSRGKGVACHGRQWRESGMESACIRGSTSRWETTSALMDTARSTILMAMSSRESGETAKEAAKVTEHLLL